MKLKILFLLCAFSIYSEIKASESLGIDQIATERMYGYRLNEDSFNNLFTLVSNPQVGAGLLKGILTADETKKKLTDMLLHWKSRGFGSWMFYEKATGKFIGRAGLHAEIIHEKDERIVSYTVMPEFWNKGFATEMAKGCLKMGFDLLKFQSLICFTRSNNKTAKHVIQKTGFKFEIERKYDFPPCEVSFYRLTNEEYQKSKSEDILLADYV